MWNPLRRQGLGICFAVVLGVALLATPSISAEIPVSAVDPWQWDSGSLERQGFADWANRKGLGLDLSGGFGFMRVGTYLESIVFDDSLVIYCSGAVGLSSKALANISLSGRGIVTTGCKNPSDYRGGFLTLSVGGGVLVEGALTLSMGFDYGHFFSTMGSLLRTAPNYKKDLAKTVQLLINDSKARSISLGDKIFLLSLAAQLDGVELGPGQFLNLFAGSLSKGDSSRVVEEFESGRWQQEINPNWADHLPPTQRYLYAALREAFFGAITGCNAVSIGLGVGTPGGAPLFAEVSLSHYVKYRQIPLSVFKRLFLLEADPSLAYLDPADRMSFQTSGGFFFSKLKRVCRESAAQVVQDAKQWKTLFSQ